MSEVYNPIFLIRQNKINEDSFKYNLRKNNILSWIDKYEKYIKFKEIIQTCGIESNVKIESGILNINFGERFLGYEFVPYIKSNMSFIELLIILKSKVIDFENSYGNIFIDNNKLDMLKKLVYYYNRKISLIDIEDKKTLIHLDNSSIVLHYALINKVHLIKQVNNWCTLRFSINNEKIDYCTIFSEEQIELLEYINKLINQNK